MCTSQLHCYWHLRSISLLIKRSWMRRENKILDNGILWYCCAHMLIFSLVSCNYQSIHSHINFWINDCTSKMVKNMLSSFMSILLAYELVFQVSLWNVVTLYFLVSLQTIKLADYMLILLAPWVTFYYGLHFGFVFSILFLISWS